MPHAEVSSSVAVSSAELWLVRHGATPWSDAGRHTGTTDVPLTPEGEAAARDVGPRLAGVRFDVVLTSPFVRARRTAELAGLSPDVEPLLREWDYGDAEGRTREELQAVAPGWSPWTAPMTGGEALADLSRRADAAIAVVLARLEAAGTPDGRAVLVAHGHLLRVLTVRWIGLDAVAAQHFPLAPAAIGILGHDRGTRAVRRWDV